jgi:hypothetical protein
MTSRPAGRVEIVLAPQLLQRKRVPASGTVRVSGSASTLTSAWRPQASQVAVTMRTPFKACWRGSSAIDLVQNIHQVTNTSSSTGSSVQPPATLLFDVINT